MLVHRSTSNRGEHASSTAILVAAQVRSREKFRKKPGKAKKRNTFPAISPDFLPGMFPPDSVILLTETAQASAASGGNHGKIDQVGRMRAFAPARGQEEARRGLKYTRVPISLPSRCQYPRSGNSEARRRLYNRRISASNIKHLRPAAVPVCRVLAKVNRDCEFISIQAARRDRGSSTWVRTCRESATEPMRPVRWIDPTVARAQIAGSTAPKEGGRLRPVLR
jgi:hypothetical protein